MLIEYLPKEKG